jgi:hypothetical protein
MDNWNPGSVFVDGKYISADTWYDADRKPFQPQAHYFVGGATTQMSSPCARSWTSRTSPCWSMPKSSG